MKIYRCVSDDLNLYYIKNYIVKKKKINHVQKIFHELIYRDTPRFIFKSYCVTLIPEFTFTHHQELLHLIQDKGVVEDENGCNNTRISYIEHIRDVSNLNQKNVGKVYIQYRESNPLNLLDLSDAPIFPSNPQHLLNAIGLLFCLNEFKYHYAIINLSQNCFALGACVYFQKEKVHLTCFFDEYIRLGIRQEFEVEKLSNQDLAKMKNLNCAINYTNSLIQGLSCDLRGSKYKIYLFTEAHYSLNSKEDQFQRKIMKKLGWNFDQRVIQDGYKLHHLYLYSEKASVKISHLSLAFGLGFIGEPRPNFIKSAQ